MAENRQFKYAEKITSSGFSKTLAERVDAYFEALAARRAAVQAVAICCSVPSCQAVRAATALVHTVC